MVGHRMRVFVLAGASVAASLSAASAATAAGFNGSWTLVAQTTNGHCRHSYFDITISKGQVLYPGGSLMGFPAGVGGTVAASGQTKLKLVAGPRVATGTGRLGPAQGSGTWSGTGPSGAPVSGLPRAFRRRPRPPRPQPPTSPTRRRRQGSGDPPPMPMPVYQWFGTSGQ
jgi:hypothetical protein